MTKLLTKEATSKNYDINVLINNIEESFKNISKYDIPERHFHKTEMKVN